MFCRKTQNNNKFVTFDVKWRVIIIVIIITGLKFSPDSNSP